MRTAHRIPATAGLAGAAQNAPIGHPGLWISARRAFCPAVACSWEVAASLVPTRRLAPVEGQSAPLSPALGPGIGCGKPILHAWRAGTPIVGALTSPGPSVPYSGGLPFGTCVDLCSKTLLWVMYLLQ